MQMRGRVARYANVIDVFDRNPCRRETIAQSSRRKSRAMLDAVEALFLSGRHDPSVFD
jgi:hypothetical protein